MGKTSILKTTGIVIASWAVLLIVQSNLGNTLTELLTDNIAEVKMEKIEPDISNKMTKESLFSSNKLVEEPISKANTPCAKSESYPSLACDAYIVKKLEMDNDSENLAGIQLVWRFIENYKTSDQMRGHVERVATSDDLRLSKLSNLILKNLSGGLVTTASMSVVQEENKKNTQMINADNSIASSLKESLTHVEADVQKIMSSGDTFIRLKAVEIATMQADDHAMSLLKEAVKDSDDNVRRMAVAGLSVFIEQGIIDPEEVLNSLEENRLDSDIEVAELTNALFDRYELPD